MPTWFLQVTINERGCWPHVEPEIPTLLADDRDIRHGDWRALKAARKQPLLAQLAAGGIPTTGLKTRVEMIAARNTWIPASPSPVSIFDEDDSIVDWSWKAER